MTEQEITYLVKNDPWMMKVLCVAESLNLPDWMIGAGFIRNKVWDHLHGFSNDTVPTNDIDLIYFDKGNTSTDFEKECETKLKQEMGVEWSVKNMARMHEKSGDGPYKSAADGLAHWVETATAVAVKLENGGVKLIAPYGLSDLVGLVVKPTLYMKNRMQDFNRRYKEKGWLEHWPKLRVVVD